MVDYNNILDLRKKNYIKTNETKAADFEYPDGVNTGLTAYDFSLILMYQPADTVAHTQNEEPAIRYHTPPTMSWPGTKDDDLLSAIDRVKISVAYRYDIGQSLILD